MAGKKIVIVGGGFGGVAAARAARSLLGREHSVILVDRDRRTHLCGSFPLLIVGERDSSKASRSLGLLANRGIDYRQEEVTSIDISAKTVITNTGVLEYDYLVIALGATYDWGAVPGASSAYSFYDLPAARRLRNKLSRFRRGRIVIAVASVPYKCPPAPFEAALILDWAFTQRGVRSDVEIHVFTPEPAPLPVAGPQAASRLSRDLNRRGILFHREAGVTNVSQNGREASFSDGSSIDADLVITIPSHRSHSIVIDTGLVGDSGWIDVSPETLETASPNIYAVGDATMIQMANGRPLPKAGVFASSEGVTVGHNIAAEIHGSASIEFPGIGHCFITYSGQSAGMVRGNFLAPDKPDVRLHAPTTRGYRAKERFERDWRRFRV